MLVIAAPNSAGDCSDSEEPLTPCTNSGRWQDVSELTGSVSPNQSVTGSVLSARDRRRCRDSVSRN